MKHLIIFLFKNILAERFKKSLANFQLLKAQLKAHQEYLSELLS
jgi:hypothetical protein